MVERVFGARRMGNLTHSFTCFGVDVALALILAVAPVGARHTADRPHRKHKQLFSKPNNTESFRTVLGRREL